jgi:stress-induced morphogen
MKRFSTAISTGEKLLRDKISNALQCSKVVVQDISGGCGSMYEVQVTSTKFKDLSLVKQHKLIADILKDEIKGMHGIRINTFVE